MRKSEIYLTKKEFKEIFELAQNVYNITIVMNYFIENHSEIEECYNLVPIVQLLHTNADLLNSFFTNKKSKFKNNIF